MIPVFTSRLTATLFYRKTVFNQKYQQVASDVYIRGSLLSVERTCLMIDCNCQIVSSMLEPFVSPTGACSADLVNNCRHDTLVPHNNKQYLRILVFVHI